MAKAKKKKKEVTEITLTKEETQKVKNIQMLVDRSYAVLGKIRKQSLAQEKKSLNEIIKWESELMSYMQEVAKNKDIPENEKWGFNPVECKFVKQT